MIFQRRSALERPVELPISTQIIIINEIPKLRRSAGKNGSARLAHTFSRRQRETSTENRVIQNNILNTQFAKRM